MRRGLLLGLAIILAPSVARPQAGQPLGPEFRVNTGMSFVVQPTSSVSMDADGDFVVAWLIGFPGGGAGAIHAQRYSSSGAPAGSEFLVNTSPISSQGSVDVASDPAGNFVVVWSGADGSAEGVVGQRYAASGAPQGSEFVVNSHTTSSQRQPSVACDPSGGFVVVWQGAGFDGTNGVFAQRYAGTGAPAGAEFRVNSYTLDSKEKPSIATDGSGNFIVAWMSFVQDGSSHGVFGQRFAASGMPMGPEFRINTYTTSVQAIPDVAAAGAGNFVVTWASKGQEGEPGGGGGTAPFGIYAQRYSSTGAPVGPEFRVNTYTTQNQYWHRVAMDAAGNFVVVWSSSVQDYGSYGVYGQRYESSGPPRGGEFRVNTFTTGSQTVPGVAADTAGNFVVVWNSDGQYGIPAIFGQRFGQIVPVELTHFQVE